MVMQDSRHTVRHRDRKTNEKVCVREQQINKSKGITLEVFHKNECVRPEEEDGIRLFKKKCQFTPLQIKVPNEKYHLKVKVKVVYT